MTTSARDASWSTRPKPIPNSFTEPFWSAAREGTLVVPRCLDCGSWRWPPQLACPECWSERFDWAPTGGTGVLYSYTEVHRSVDYERFPGPYALALVELDEGPVLLTNVIDYADGQLRVGLRVEVRFQHLDDEITVYPFAPTTNEAP